MVLGEKQRENMEREDLARDGQEERKGDGEREASDIYLELVLEGCRQRSNSKSDGTAGAYKKPTQGPKEEGREVTFAVETYVRALFDYSGGKEGRKNEDEEEWECCEPHGLPSPPGRGLRLRAGTVVKVAARRDYDWWLGETELGEKGLIPSPELIERCALQNPRPPPEPPSSPRCFPLSFTRRRKQETYLAKHNAVFDSLDTTSYEHVIRLSAHPPRTLVLLGTPGVGRSHVTHELLRCYPKEFSLPVRYTTKVLVNEEEDTVSEEKEVKGKDVDEKEGEKDNKENKKRALKEAEMVKENKVERRQVVDGFMQVDERDIRAALQRGELLEMGTYEKELFALSFSAMSDTLSCGLTPILDISPSAVKMLQAPEFSPFVVFVSPPPPAPNEDPSLPALREASLALRRSAARCLHLSVSLYHAHSTSRSAAPSPVKKIYEAFIEARSTPRWVPLSWLADAPRDSPTFAKRDSAKQKKEGKGEQLVEKNDSSVEKESEAVHDKTKALVPYDPFVPSTRYTTL
uniref:55 kDa erythrocyte membrane protein-like n=1 Tax=Myxine glutinosa TaxID=7769 RepID=UPI00358E4FFF